jgi:thiol-disulfide isomerase/thioredoxin
MNSRLVRGIETSANVAIILAAVLLATVLVKQHLLDGTRTQASSPQPGVAVGAQLTTPDVDWSGNKRTLLLVLSTTCHFCSESAPLYQRLVKESGVRPIAVVPQSVAEGRLYLNRLGVPVGDVRQLSLDSIGVSGTPTLLLVDDAGHVSGKWVGKLDPDREAELLEQVRASANARQ